MLYENEFGIVAAKTEFIDDQIKQVRSVLKLREHSIPQTVDIGLFEKHHCSFLLEGCSAVCPMKIYGTTMMHMAAWLGLIPKMNLLQWGIFTGICYTYIQAVSKYRYQVAVPQVEHKSAIREVQVSRHETDNIASGSDELSLSY